jgi:hypothetical protein
MPEVSQAVRGSTGRQAQLTVIYVTSSMRRHGARHLGLRQDIVSWAGTGAKRARPPPGARPGIQCTSGEIGAAAGRAVTPRNRRESTDGLDAPQKPANNGRVSLDAVTRAPGRPAGPGMYLHWEGRKGYRTRMRRRGCWSPVPELGCGERREDRVIEGDNLQVMVSLRSQYQGAIGVADLDPPTTPGAATLRTPMRAFAARTRTPRTWSTSTTRTAAGIRSG